VVQIDGMQSHLAQLGFTKKPKMIPKVVRANLKKRMQQDERLAEIEAENARLLSQMTRIMDAPDNLSRLKKPPLSSLNVVTRRREMERVTHENMRMLRALEDTPSYYNHRVWMAERREQEHMLSYIGMYPYHEGTGVRSRTQMRSHTDVDDVWLRSVTSLSRKSALSLPELTKSRDMRFSRNDSPGEPWALPALPGQENLYPAPLERSDLSGTTSAPTRNMGGAKSLDKLRADSSSGSEGEEDETAVKKADEPLPASHSVSQDKPSAPAAQQEADSDDEPSSPPATPPAVAQPPTGAPATVEPASTAVSQSEVKAMTRDAGAAQAPDATDDKDAPPPTAATPLQGGEASGRAQDEGPLTADTAPLGEAVKDEHEGEAVAGAAAAEGETHNKEEESATPNASVDEAKQLLDHAATPQAATPSSSVQTSAGDSVVAVTHKHQGGESSQSAEESQCVDATTSATHQHTPATEVAVAAAETGGVEAAAAE